MKRFDKLIRSLTEGIKTLTDLQSDHKTRIFITMENEGDKWSFMMYNKTNRRPLFMMDLYEHRPDYWTGHTGVLSNELKGEGYGPLGYDIAMELITFQNKQMTPATLMGGRNSDDSARVWEFYYKNRNDVKKTEFKDLPERIQSIHSDNENLETDLEERPWLYASYQKPDTSTVKELMDSGLIKFKK